VEVATGAKAAESLCPDGISHTLEPMTAGDTGLWLPPTQLHDAFAAIDLEANATVALRILISILEENLAVVRCLDRKKETSILKREPCNPFHACYRIRHRGYCRTVDPNVN
jgi:hypothetical protein